MGDIVSSDSGDRFARIQVTGIGLHAGDDGVLFSTYGTRFRKDGTLGKLRERVYLRFEGDKAKGR